MRDKRFIIKINSFNIWNGRELNAKWCVCCPHTWFYYARKIIRATHKCTQFHVYTHKRHSLCARDAKAHAFCMWLCAEIADALDICIYIWTHPRSQHIKIEISPKSDTKKRTQEKKIMLVLFPVIWHHAFIEIYTIFTNFQFLHHLVPLVVRYSCVYDSWWDCIIYSFINCRKRRSFCLRYKLPSFISSTQSLYTHVYANRIFMFCS